MVQGTIMGMVHHKIPPVMANLDMGNNRFVNLCNFLSQTR